MLSKNQILLFLEANKNYFLNNFNVSKVGIFGSYATGKQNDKSDLDIIVEFIDGTENLYELKQNIREYIQKNLNLKVDICREKYIKNIFKDSILKSAYYV
jgi:uncharacterized protein